MTTSPPAVDPARARRALARSVGLAAFIYGYPLMETWRTCRQQTLPAAQPAAGNGSDLRGARLNTLHHSQRPSTHEDRDVVTPANDLLYSLAWIHLADGPVLLTVPSSRKHGGRYFVLALYDAHTENFANLGARNCAAEGETVLLTGADARIPEHLKHYRAVPCPTNLVWLIGRTVVGDAPDWPAARALQADMALIPAPGTPSGNKPPALDNWAGAPVDAMAAIVEQGRPAEAVAPDFFTNLCHILAETPGRVEDSGLLAWFGRAGLHPNPALRWEQLPAPVQQGLTEGLLDGVHTMQATAGGVRRPKPWAMTTATGRYGSEYLGRALTAYLGLGALATDEAIYAAAHFDAACQPLSGQQRYVLRFAAGDMPPVDAFWSVTLYGADRFLYGNEIGRHSIGDRTSALAYEADGSLCIDIAHQRPARGAANWLPAPAGRFYLILRMYYPREDLKSWQIPPLQAV